MANNPKFIKNILFCDGRNVLHLPIVDRKEKGRKQEEERMLNNEKFNETQDGYPKQSCNLPKHRVVFIEKGVFSKRQNYIHINTRGLSSVSDSQEEG